MTLNTFYTIAATGRPNLLFYLLLDNFNKCSIDDNSNNYRDKEYEDSADDDVNNGFEDGSKRLSICPSVQRLPMFIAIRCRR